MVVVAAVPMVLVVVATSGCGGSDNGIGCSGDGDNGGGVGSCANSVERFKVEWNSYIIWNLATPMVWMWVEIDFWVKCEDPKPFSHSIFISLVIFHFLMFNLLKHVLP